MVDARATRRDAAAVVAGLALVAVLRAAHFRATHRRAAVGRWVAISATAVGAGGARDAVRFADIAGEVAAQVERVESLAAQVERRMARIGAGLWVLVD